MGEVFEVVWSKKVQKQLDRVPLAVGKKFYAWVAAVSLVGIRELRKRTGFHDEPLKGRRKGQRSVRLNKAYRAIYIEVRDEKIELIEVIEVNKHAY